MILGRRITSHGLWTLGYDVSFVSVDMGSTLSSDISFNSPSASST